MSVLPVSTLPIAKTHLPQRRGKRDNKSTQPPQWFQATSLLDRIGNTPLLPLHRIPCADGISSSVFIFAKAEWFNPGGSVKDRPALSMVLAGEESGQLHAGKTILESTSGNTGIGLAMIGAVKGYPVKLVMPENVSSERKGILKAYGAELIFTDPLEGSDGAILEAWRIYKEDPDRYFKPDQYTNPANWQAHYRTTAPEIWEQTNGYVSHFVAGLGTTGTFMGTGRRLKELNPAIELIAVQPADEFVVIEGLKHLETSIVPGIYNEALADQQRAVFPEAAYEMTQRLAKEEGLFVGLSAGAAMVAAMEVARSIDEGVIVALFPDGGEKYLSVRG